MEGPPEPTGPEEKTPLLVEPGAPKRDEGQKPAKITYADGTEQYIGKGKSGNKKYNPVPAWADKKKNGSKGRLANALHTAGASKDIKQLTRRRS